MLAHGEVVVRPMRWSDAGQWARVRARNEAWLAPWEGRPERQSPATWGERHSAAVFRMSRRRMHREARAGRALPFLVTYRGDLAGQVTVNNVVRGAFDSAALGWWVDGQLAGRGITPTAVALVADHCFRAVGLHRLEANIRPENQPSRRVAEKLGFVQEARYRRYLFIDGAWRDHLGFSLLREDAPQGVLRRLLSGG